MDFTMPARIAKRDLPKAKDVAWGNALRHLRLKHDGTRYLRPVDCDPCELILATLIEVWGSKPIPRDNLADIIPLADALAAQEGMLAHRIASGHGLHNVRCRSCIGTARWVLATTSQSRNAVTEHRHQHQGREDARRLAKHVEHAHTTQLLDPVKCSQCHKGLVMVLGHLLVEPLDLQPAARTDPAALLAADLRHRDHAHTSGHRSVMVECDDCLSTCADLVEAIVANRSVADAMDRTSRRLP